MSEKQRNSRREQPFYAVLNGSDPEKPVFVAVIMARTPQGARNLMLDVLEQQVTIRKADAHDIIAIGHRQGRLITSEAVLQMKADIARAKAGPQEQAEPAPKERTEDHAYPPDQTYAEAAMRQQSAEQAA